ncbi:unnamed protein product [Amoebophrya sp. A25]|nr:unnamed protein product [Amoebophrya sp. A25]|eukprot:GSA25T00008036001.1
MIRRTFDEISASGALLELRCSYTGAINEEGYRTTPVDGVLVGRHDPDAAANTQLLVACRRQPNDDEIALITLLAEPFGTNHYIIFEDPATQIRYHLGRSTTSGKEDMLMFGTNASSVDAMAMVTPELVHEVGQDGASVGFGLVKLKDDTNKFLALQSKADPSLLWKSVGSPTYFQLREHEFSTSTSTTTTSPSFDAHADLLNEELYGDVSMSSYYPDSQHGEAWKPLTYELGGSRVWPGSCAHSDNSAARTGGKRQWWRAAFPGNTTKYVHHIVLWKRDPPKFDPLRNDARLAFDDILGDPRVAEISPTSMDDDAKTINIGHICDCHQGTTIAVRRKINSITLFAGSAANDGKFALCGIHVHATPGIQADLLNTELNAHVEVKSEDAYGHHYAWRPLAYRTDVTDASRRSDDGFCFQSLGTGSTRAEFPSARGVSQIVLWNREDDAQTRLDHARLMFDDTLGDPRSATIADSDVDIEALIVLDFLVKEPFEDAAEMLEA